ncbi:MAG TPA: MFS transporter [Acidimicrobiia bacterium]|nr:MFS transporter [Acidimicrobiia bacterium]
MLAAALLARTGATMVGLSMGFVAYEQTASAFTVAVVAASFGLAFAASSLIAGHVLARIGLRAMLVGALASQFAGALALASVTSTAGADVTWLTIFSVVAGLASALIFVGSQMLLHGVAPGDHLQRVVSLDSATASLSRIGGPALGGVLLAAIGVPPVFLIAAFCYLPLLAVVAILAVSVNDQRPAHRPRLRDAARFFRQLAILRWALLTAALAELIALPLVQMMPAVTESLNRDAADRLGILVACVAVGSLGQVLVIEWLRARHDTRVVVGVVYAAAGALLLGLALDEELFVAGALLVAFGLTVSIGRTMLLTSVHVASPDSHRAHVLSLYIFVTSVATPIGALLWGVVADWLNIDATLGGAGVLLMLGIGAGLISILRHEAAAPPAAVSEMAKTPGG